MRKPLTLRLTTTKTPEIKCLTTFENSPSGDFQDF